MTNAVGQGRCPSDRTSPSHTTGMFPGSPLIYLYYEKQETILTELSFKDQSNGSLWMALPQGGSSPLHNVLPTFSVPCCWEGGQTTVSILHALASCTVDDLHRTGALSVTV